CLDILLVTEKGSSLDDRAAVHICKNAASLKRNKDEPNPEKSLDKGNRVTPCVLSRYLDVVEPVYVQNRVSVNEISSSKKNVGMEGKMVKSSVTRLCLELQINVVLTLTIELAVIILFLRFITASIRSGCTKALASVPGKQTANLFYREIVMTNTQTPPTVVNTTGAPVTNAVANHAEKPGKNIKWPLRWFLKELAPQTTTAKNYGSLLNASTRQKDALVQRIFVVARFLDYRWLSQRAWSVRVSRSASFAARYFIAEGMTLSVISVAAIIEQGPTSCPRKDFYTPDSAKANMVEHAGSSSRFNSKGNKKDKGKNDKKGKGKSEYLALKAGL
ncbi:hypothetical protein Tco_0943422, partial [Tanacetum coccineum]